MLKKRWSILATLLLMGLLVIGMSFQAMAAKSDDDDEEKEQLEEVSGLWWDDNGEANWDEIEGVYQYEVSLYRDGSKVTTVKTKAEKYKFYSKMTKDGEYTFRVRPLAKSRDKNYTNGPWSEYSESFDVDEDYADRVKKNKTSSGSGDDEDDNDQKPTAAEGWQSDGTGRWWQRKDGSYPRSQWMTINNNQYYFDSTGYMVTGWQEIDGNQCYFDENGVYRQNGVQTQGQGEWQQDNAGRWWKRADGTYPVNDWLELEGKWYFFDASGYMKTGWIPWKGQWYYCGQDGVMVTNAYVENKYWVDENGVWAQ